MNSKKTGLPLKSDSFRTSPVKPNLSTRGREKSGAFGPAGVVSFIVVEGALVFVIISLVVIPVVGVVVWGGVIAPPMPNKIIATNTIAIMAAGMPSLVE